VTGNVETRGSSFNRKLEFDARLQGEENQIEGGGEKLNKRRKRNMGNPVVRDGEKRDSQRSLGDASCFVFVGNKRV